MSSLIGIYKKYIRGTAEKAIVSELTIYICNLTIEVREALDFKFHKVYITTRVIKKMFDKRPAEEFEYLLKNLIKIIKHPEAIYKNKDSKTGDFCFVKKLDKQQYICSIEVSDDRDPGDGIKGINYVVTAFRDRKKKYLKNYKLLWSWKGDNPSS